jgi:hypothetical protein
MTLCEPFSAFDWALYLTEDIAEPTNEVSLTWVILREQIQVSPHLFVWSGEPVPRGVHQIGCDNQTRPLVAVAKRLLFTETVKECPRDRVGRRLRSIFTDVLHHRVYNLREPDLVEG